MNLWFFMKVHIKNPRLLIVNESANLTFLNMQELENDGYYVEAANSIALAVELHGKNVCHLLSSKPWLRT